MKYIKSGSLNHTLWKIIGALSLEYLDVREGVEEGIEEGVEPVLVDSPVVYSSDHKMSFREQWEVGKHK